MDKNEIKSPKICRNISVASSVITQMNTPRTVDSRHNHSKNVYFVYTLLARSVHSFGSFVCIAHSTLSLLLALSLSISYLELSLMHAYFPHWRDWPEHKFKHVERIFHFQFHLYATPYTHWTARTCNVFSSVNYINSIWVNECEMYAWMDWWMVALRYKSVSSLSPPYYIIYLSLRHQPHYVNVLIFNSIHNVMRMRIFRLWRWHCAMLNKNQQENFAQVPIRISPLSYRTIIWNFPQSWLC